MKKHFKIIGIVTLVMALLGAATWGFAKILQPKTAYVDLVMVYNQFKLKEELDSKLQSIQMTRKSILDSMELQLNVLGQKLQMRQRDTAGQVYYMQKREQLINHQQQFEQDNNTIAQHYQEQIWKQLNQYVRDFGKEYSYTYVFGGEGSGAVMYADDSHDVTGEVKEYINKHYKGN
ncbi:MAG: OmpH family outer membrane protein [Bacteroidia bacterium]